GGTTVLPALPREIDGETPVVIASHRVVDATLRMQRNGCRNVLAAGVLQTLDPDRFPPHPFYENWLEDISDRSDKYRQVYDLLADERSRAIFDALLGYRISGDARQLAPFVDRNIFYPTELFRFTDAEVYVDGGCYTGDTIQWFIERTGGSYERIIGF